MNHSSMELELAKELTLKALDQRMLHLDTTERIDPIALGKKIAQLFNTILDEING